MLNDIGPVDRVIKPEPLKTRRDRRERREQERSEKSPVLPPEADEDEGADEAGSGRLLDVRI